MTTPSTLARDMDLWRQAWAEQIALSEAATARRGGKPAPQSRRSWTWNEDDWTSEHPYGLETI